MITMLSKLRGCAFWFIIIALMFYLSVISHHIILTYTNECPCNHTKPHVLRLLEGNTKTRESQVIYGVLQNSTSNDYSPKLAKSFKQLLVPKGTRGGPAMIPVGIMPSKAAKHSKRVVPKIVHYVRFYPYTRCTVRFYHFMSILSAYRFIQPKQIIIWYDNLPCGKWWNETKARVPILNLRRRVPPKEIFGQPIKVPEHRSDVARVDILLKYGGIYLDTDMVALRSWDPLLYYDTTLGAQSHSLLGNAAMISKKNATFLKIWKNSYHNFIDNDWNFNSVLFPLTLARKHPETIHIEVNTLYRPNFKDVNWIFNRNMLWDWSGSYGIHLYYRLYKKEHNAEDIKTLNSTLGCLFRLLYYNTTELMNINI